MGIKLYYNQTICLNDFEKELHVLKLVDYLTIEVQKNNIIFLDTVLEKTRPITMFITIKDPEIILDLNKYKHLKYLTVNGNNKTYIKSLPVLNTLKITDCFIKRISLVTFELHITKSIVRNIDLKNLHRIKILKCKKFIYISFISVFDFITDNKYIKLCYFS